MSAQDPLALLGQYAGSDDEGSADSGSASDSSNSSVDSAALRAAEAEQRLRDFGEASSKPKAGPLPSALDAFEEVEDAPEFLNPEATRPIVTSTTHGLVAAATSAAPAARGPRHGPKGRVPAGQEFDIAKLAPPLKGQQQQSDKRGPAGAVIEGKAKRYKADEGPEANQQYTAAQIAMMGGNVPVAAALAAAADAGNDSGGDVKGPRKPSKAMGVNDFLDKGVGGALLPRKAQDRKEKEKKKRAAGQSAIGSWKTEAEMVLRQQYDS